MFEKLKRRIARAPRPVAATVDDLALGTLSWSTLDKAWLSSPSHRGLGFSFQICGSPLPSSAHLGHAASIAANKEPFIRDVQRLLAVEAATSVRFRAFRDEIAGLTISCVSLCWENLPGQGLVYFNGGREGRTWACYCSDLVPKVLDFKGPIGQISRSSAKENC